MENSHVKQVDARRDPYRECYGSREEGTPLGLGRGVSRLASWNTEHVSALKDYMGVHDK